jgi:hypothetical protein
LADDAYVQWYASQVRAGLMRMMDGLRALGVDFFPSHANFVLMKIGTKHAELVKAMRARGVLLRDRSTDPGCDGYVRITVGVEEHVTRGLAALKESLAEIGWAPEQVARGVGVMSRIRSGRKWWSGSGVSGDERECWSDELRWSHWCTRWSSLLGESSESAAASKVADEVRTGTVKRDTTETQIALTLTIDGTGVYSVSTGIRFFDHMLELFTRHGGFDLTLKCKGDLDVDQHHTVEDVGIALGEAFGIALGDKKGICAPDIL